MYTKPPVIQWTDRLLMAPWRYMDFHGRSPNAGAFANFIHVPETKILAISMGAAGALNIGARGLLTMLAMAGAITAVRSLSRSFHAARASHYLDTAPDGIIPLQPQTKEILRRVRPSLTKIFTTSTPLAGGICIGMTVGGYDTGITAATGAMVFMYDTTRGLAARYRVDRLIKSDWNYMVGRAPPEPAKQKEAIGIPAPAPG